MESYCVIHFKNKPEKGRILTFLAVETEAEYHVTTDLKGFVAKQFGVTILENNEEVLNSTNDTTGIPNIVEETKKHDSTNNVVTASVNTFPTEQQPSSALIVPQQSTDCTVSVQQVLVKNKKRRLIDTITIKEEIDDIVENVVSPMAVVEELESGEIFDSPTMNNNTFHNFVFLQPPDVTDEPQNLTNVPKTEETAATNEDVPSTSEGNRKRPNSSTVDHNGNETAAKKRKNDERAMVSDDEKKVDQCEICGLFVLQYKVEHIMMHAKIKKYECLVRKCGYNVSYKLDILDHMQKNHETQLKCFKEHKLTCKELKDIDEIKKICFPEWKEGVCQVCNFITRGRYPAATAFLKREHAIYHLSLELYKCTKEGCCYKGATKNDLISHKQKIHGRAGKKKIKRNELTEEQESRVEEMLVKCFPNQNSNHIDDSNA